MESNKEYFAFVSYQRKDEEWAEKLRNKLEHYRLPSNVRKQDASLPKEIRPIFRDALELAGGVLEKEIEKALQQSKYLIVICSPNSAKSPWVNKEIQTFIDLGREDHIIPFIIDGTPYSENEDTECFPPALCSLKGEREVLGININEMGRDAAAIKVVAQMFGLKFDTLWQRYEREKRKRRWMIVGLSLLIALVSLGIGGYIARQNSMLKEKDWKMMENQAKAVAEKATQLADAGDSFLACLLALEVLPSNIDQPDRPYTSEAEAALRKACQYNQAILKGHEDDVNSASFSPDGKKLVSASDDKTVRIWEAETGLCLQVLEGHIDEVEYAVFSPDGKHIVSASGDKTIRIWDAESGQCLQVLDGHTGGVETVAYHPDGNLIVSASLDSTIRIWDSGSGQCVKSLTGHSGRVHSAFFSPVGKQIVSASGYGDMTVRIWDAETGKCIRTLNGHEKERLDCASYSPDGKRIVSAAFDGTARIWDAETGECLQVLKDEEESINWYAVFSPDGKYVLTPSSDNNIFVWDVESGERLLSLSGHQKWVNSISFSQDGQYFVSASSDNTLRVWSKNKSIQGIENSGGKCLPLIMQSPDGKKTMLSYYCNIYILDTATEQLLRTLEGHSDEITFISFSPDSRRVLSASFDHTIRVWDAETGECIKTLESDGNLNTSVFYSSDNCYIVGVSLNSQRVHLWDAKTWKSIPFLEGELISFASFSPDRKHLVLANSNNILINDIKTGQCIQTMKGHTESINTVYFSQDGKYIVSASNDNTIRVWDSATGECIHVIEDHKGGVMSAVFSPDGQYIVSASYDNTIRVWNTTTGQCLLTENIENVNIAFFSFDGHQIVTFSGDRNIITWDFPPLQQLIDETRERFKNRPLTPEERRKYYLE